MVSQTGSVMDLFNVVGRVRVFLGLSRLVVDDHRVPLPEMHALTFVCCEKSSVESVLVRTFALSRAGLL